MKVPIPSFFIFKMNIKKSQKGITALVLMTFLNSIMGIWVRFLGEHFMTFQQVAARALIGFIIGILVYHKRVRILNLFKKSRKDLLLLLFRSLSLVIGIGLFTVSIMKTKFANVHFIFSLPMTAFLGIVFLRERLTFKKAGLLFVGFFGVILISFEGFSDGLSFGLGEILALISTFFYSLTFISRKWFSKNIKNEEIAVFGAFFTFCYAVILSQLFGDGINEFLTVNPFLLIIIFLAGLTFILINYFGSYGFEKVQAIIANNILVLESVFGLLFGLLLYNEIPVLREVLGGIIIVISAILMNRLPHLENFKSLNN